jgi:hypothetical protein
VSDPGAGCRIPVLGAGSMYLVPDPGTLFRIWISFSAISFYSLPSAVQCTFKSGKCVPMFLKHSSLFSDFDVFLADFVFSRFLSIHFIKRVCFKSVSIDSYF